MNWNSGVDLSNTIQRHEHINKVKPEKAIAWLVKEILSDNSLDFCVKGSKMK